MSAIIKNMVLRKRQQEADASERERFLAQAKGDTGPKGERGLPGAPGLPPLHEWLGTSLRFELPGGRWGPAVELKGRPGADGKAGRVVVVARGGGGTDVDTLAEGTGDVEPSGVVVYQAGRAVNLPWQAFLALTGSGDEALTRRVDFVGEATIYRGEAAPGSSESDPVWRIRRFTFVTGPDGKQDVNETWASGTANFDHVWNDRATVEYS